MLFQHGELHPDLQPFVSPVPRLQYYGMVSDPGIQLQPILGLTLTTWIAVCKEVESEKQPFCQGYYIETKTMTFLPHGATCVTISTLFRTKLHHLFGLFLSSSFTFLSFPSPPAFVRPQQSVCLSGEIRHTSLNFWVAPAPPRSGFPVTHSLFGRPNPPFTSSFEIFNQETSSIEPTGSPNTS